jgi:hypothetical protein
MQLHFNTPEAEYLIKIIQIHRPRWARTAIMAELQIAALAGATLGQVTTAAEKAMKNPKNIAPPSINFPENWENEKPKTAGNLMAPRLCVECTAKKPVTEMTKHAHGWVCNTHTEEGTK